MVVEGVPGYTNSSADALLLVAQLGLFNIYLYMIAYLYAPAADGGGPTHYEQQESQDDKIIKYAPCFRELISLETFTRRSCLRCRACAPRRSITLARGGSTSATRRKK